LTESVPVLDTQIRIADTELWQHYASIDIDARTWEVIPNAPRAYLS